MNLRFKLFLNNYFFAVFLLLSLSNLYCIDKDVKIGVLQKNTVREVRTLYNPLAEYLTDNNLNGLVFSIVPLPFDKIINAVSNSEVDFLICNPLIYTELEIRYNIKRLLTMERKQDYGTFSFFSSLVFVKSSNKEIENYKDLKNKKIAAVALNSFGGWLMAAYELKKTGLRIPGDFKEIKFLGSHEQVIKSVLSGDFDAGIVRSGTVEEIFAQKMFKRDQIKNIGGTNHNNDRLPFLHSTEHYPEWPFSKLEHTPDYISKNVMSLLLKSDNKNSISWTVPGNYETVREVMKVLKYGPYEDYRKVSLFESFKQHLIYNLIMIVSIITLSIFILRINILHMRIKTVIKERNEISQKTDIMMLKVRDDGKIISANNSAAVKFSTTPDNLKGKFLSDILPKDQLETRFSGMKKASETGDKVVFQAECYRGWSEIEIQPVLRNKKSRYQFYNFIVKDITDWVNVSFELEKQNKMLDLLKEMIVIADTEGTILQYNNAFDIFYKSEDDQLKGSNISIIERTDDSDEYLNIKKTVIPDTGIHKNISIFNKYNEEYQVSSRILPLRNKGGKIENFIFVFRDRREEISAAYSDREHNKMIAVKNITSGIAHDINNYLMKIAGLAEMISIKCKNNPDVLLNSSKLLGEIRKASNIIEILIKNVDEKDSTSSEAVLNITDFLRSFSKKYTIPENSKKIDFSIAAESILIKAVEADLKESLTQIINNSFEALSSEGQINLETEVVLSKSKYHFNAGYNLEEKNYFLIKIKDTGCGIAPENEDLVFDPYFSTKGLGRGMGLFFVKNYVKKVDGLIYIKSKKGLYTEVEIFFPVISE